MKRDETVFEERFKIAGVNHENRMSFIYSNVTVGSRLKAVAENNRHDPSAIAIYFEDTKIGYVPKEINTTLPFRDNLLNCDTLILSKIEEWNEGFWKLEASFFNVIKNNKIQKRKEESLELKKANFTFNIDQFKKIQNEVYQWKERFNEERVERDYLSDKLFHERFNETPFISYKEYAEDKRTEVEKVLEEIINEDWAANDVDSLKKDLMKYSVLEISYINGKHYLELYRKEPFYGYPPALDEIKKPFYLGQFNDVKFEDQVENNEKIECFIINDIQFEGDNIKLNLYIPIFLKPINNSSEIENELSINGIGVFKNLDGMLHYVDKETESVFIYTISATISKYNDSYILLFTIEHGGIWIDGVCNGMSLHKFEEALKIVSKATGFDFKVAGKDSKGSLMSGGKNSREYANLTTEKVYKDLNFLILDFKVLYNLIPSLSGYITWFTYASASKSIMEINKEVIEKINDYYILISRIDSYDDDYGNYMYQKSDRLIDADIQDPTEYDEDGDLIHYDM